MRSPILSEESKLYYCAQYLVLLTKLNKENFLDRIKATYSFVVANDPESSVGKVLQSEILLYKILMTPEKKERRKF